MKFGFKDAIFSAAFKTFSYLPLVLGGNTSKDKVILKPGERVIQGIFVPYFLTDEDESELETAKYKERQGGIGSTNKEQYDA